MFDQYLCLNGLFLYHGYFFLVWLISYAVHYFYRLRSSKSSCYFYLEHSLCLFQVLQNHGLIHILPQSLLKLTLKIQEAPRHYCDFKMLHVGLDCCLRRFYVVVVLSDSELDMKQSEYFDQ